MTIKRQGILLGLLVCFLIVSLFYLMNRKDSSLAPIPDKTDGLIAYVSNEDLAITSPLIIEGNVSRIGKSKWNTSEEKTPKNLKPNETLYQDVTIHIDKVLKGELNKDEVIVRRYEVVINNGDKLIGYLPEGLPKFSPNEKVILFLAYDDSPFNQEESKSHYVTRGLYQGKWDVNKDKVSHLDNSMEKEELLKIISDHKLL